MKEIWKKNMKKAMKKNMKTIWKNSDKSYEKTIKFFAKKRRTKYRIK